LTIDQVCATCECTSNEFETVERFRAIVDKEIADNGGGVYMLAEEQLGNDYLTGKPDLVVLCENGCYLILDYKSGWGRQITAVKNLQLRGYALLVARTIKTEPDGKPIKGVLICKMPDDSKERVSRVEYDAVAISKAENEIQGIVARCSQESDTRCPSTKACQFCRAAGNPERCMENIEAGILVDPPDIESLPAITLSPLPPELAGKIKDWYQQAQNFERTFKAFRQYVKDMLEQNPDALPGMTLKEGRNVREITDSEMAFQIGLAQGWFTQEQFIKECIKVSLPSIETCAKTSLGLKKSAVTEIVAGALGDLVKTHQTAPSVEIED
jgi:hypothetical protein